MEADDRKASLKRALEDNIRYNRKFSTEEALATLLYDLRESGALEQDADNVIFLWNPKPNVQIVDNKTDIEMVIAKQRSGTTGKIMFTFHMNVMKFYWKEW
jgi:replicative DNA helicase